MPCDEAFFESTRGTYGLTAKTTLSSGSFYLYNWTSSGPVPAPGCLFPHDRQPASGAEHRQHRQERRPAHCRRKMLRPALDDTGEDTSLQSVDYSDTTWALLFNSAEDSVFAIRNCGRRLPASPGRMWMCPLPVLYTAADGLVPTGLSVDGIDYRKSARNPLPTITDPRTLYLNARQGMASSDFSGVTILLPKEAGLTELAEQINGAWQKDCSLFFSVEEVPQEEFDKRLAAGSYTIALAPIRAEGGSVYQMLQQFTAEGGGLTGWSDPIYSQRLAESAQQTGSARCALLADCERQLLEGCAVVPLLGQNRRLLVADGITGLVFDPFTRCWT